MVDEKLKNMDDVWVVQGLQHCELSLGLIPNHFLPVDLSFFHCLDGAKHIGLNVPSFVHFAKRPCTQHFFDLVEIRDFVDSLYSSEVAKVELLGFMDHS